MQMGTITGEVRQAARGLRRNPALAATAVFTLALGIGATTVVFSVFYAALLQPLPFRDAEHVVELAETRLEKGWTQMAFTEANFWDLRALNRSFEELGAYHFGDANLIGNGPAEKVSCIAISAGFLRALGVTPVLGRDFTEQDAQKGATRVLLLGNRFWKTRFAADPGIMGKTLRLDERLYTVIGVLPAGEPWLDEKTYVPLEHPTDPNRGSFEFFVVGRMAPGVSIESARADLQRVAGMLAQSNPKDDKGMGFRVDSSATWVANDSTKLALRVLLGAVSFVLLIACVNIANLLLARGVSRQKEIAVRTALGASRGRLIRFVMLESILLSGLGAALGLGVAYVSLGALQGLDLRIPRLLEAGLNARVLLFTALSAVFTGLLSGLAPALQSPSTAIAEGLRDGARQTGSRAQGRLRAILVAGEVALSFLLLVGAGLLVRSFIQLMKVDPGFQTEHRLMFSVSMPDAYWEKGVGKQFLDQFFERVSGVGDVISAGAVSSRPLEGSNPGMGITASTNLGAAGRDVPWSSWRIVTPGYFRAVGLPLLKGRLLAESDKPVWSQKGEPEPLRHVVISERLARLLFPNQDAVGKHALLWKGQSNLDSEVVGVVGDTHERGLASSPALTVYLPYGARALVGEFVIHTRSNPLALMPTVRSIIGSLDPNLPIAEVRSFDDVIHRSVAPQRFNTILLGIFSGLALLLATIGIYGVLSYAVRRRTAEIGLRVALGASGGNILRMTISTGMRPVLAGLVVGAAGAAGLSRYFASMLFGTRPFDLPTWLAVIALVLVTALIACYLPSRRALRIDPSVSLRIE
ncbi:MAG TPA: ABC transporter permease [Bryobacteraceae bacterium]|nr:ABC transporter permease [Bryobacteraceae bacterium]